MGVLRMVMVDEDDKEIEYYEVDEFARNLSDEISGFMSLSLSAKGRKDYIFRKIQMVLEGFKTYSEKKYTKESLKSIIGNLSEEV